MHGVKSAILAMFPKGLRWQNFIITGPQKVITNTYRKVASSRLSRLLAHLWIFRLFINGKFDAYGL